jgi:hypothetical protein
MVRAARMTDRCLAVLVDDDVEAPRELAFVMPMERPAEASLPIQELIAIGGALVAVTRVRSPLLTDLDLCQRWLPTVGQLANDAEAQASIGLDLDLNWPVRGQIDDYPVALSKLNEIDDVVRVFPRRELHLALRADEVGLGGPGHILACAVFLDVTRLTPNYASTAHSSTFIAREGGSRYAVDAF